MNILIADDSKMVRHMVTTALNELGYTDITEASDVGEAKNLMKRKKIDLIISDLHMPGETGIDFLKYVRSIPEFAKVPFILQTTDSEKKNIIEAVKSGVQGYVIKPVQKAALAQKMSELATIYKFQPPSTALPPREAPVATTQVTTGISAGSLSDFASPVVKQEYGFSCEVKTGGTIPVLASIGTDAYRGFAKTLLSRYPGAQYVFMCDSSTQQKYGDVIDSVVRETKSVAITVPDIPNNRTIAQYGVIVDALCAHGVDSSWVLIAFGDMALLSVAGFVAATYRGGMRLVVVPLSLRSFLDSSVAGTWVVGGAQCEKAAGLRHSPSMLWFDGSCLTDALDVEYGYACAEFFRYAFIGGEQLMAMMTEKWELLLKRDVAVIAECARQCIAARASIRTLYMNETLRDALLHFAQPLADAMVECSTKHALNPGQALFRAIACMCEAAKKSGTLASGSFSAYVKLLQKMPTFTMPELLNHGTVFQKAFGPGTRDFGRTSVALPCGAGSVATVEDVPEAVFLEVLKNLLSTSA